MADPLICLGEAVAGLEDAKSWAGVARACAPLVLSGSAGIDVIDVICTEIRVALSSNFDRDRLHHLRLGSVALLLHDLQYRSDGKINGVELNYHRTVAVFGAIIMPVLARPSSASSGHIAEHEAALEIASRIYKRLPLQDAIFDISEFLAAAISSGSSSDADPTVFEALARATALSSSPNITLAASIAEIDQPLAPLAEAAALLYASGLSTPVPLPASSLLSATSRVCDASLAALSGALGSRRARLSLRWCLRPSFRTLSSAVAGDPPGDSGAPAEDAAPRGSEANGPPDADGSVALIGESMAELRAGVWAMARALMAPRDWGEEESGPQGEISAQREAQWVTPEDRVSEKEAVALGLSILSQLSEYMFPLEDPSHAPSPSSPGRLGDVRLETDFWQCLRAAMASEDPLIRKRASHVLSLALPPPVQAGSRAWEAFLAVHGSLEDYGMHLVEQRWDSIAIVSPWMSRPLQSSVREPRGSGAADSGGVGHGGEKMVGGNAEGYGGHEGEAKERCLEGDALGSSQNVVARFEAVLSAEWALVLWKRALGHRNASVVRHAATSFLSANWDTEKAGLIPPEFILSDLAPALSTQHVFPKAPATAGWDWSPWQSDLGAAAARFAMAWGCAWGEERVRDLVGRLLKGAAGSGGRVQMTRTTAAAYAGLCSALAAGARRGLPLRGVPSQEWSQQMLNSVTVVIRAALSMSGAAFRHKLIAHLIAAVALTVPPTLDLRHSISSLLTGLFPEFLSPVFTPAPASIDSPGPHAPGFPPLLPGLPDIPNPVLSWLISWLSPAPGQESGRDENCGGGSPLQDAVVEGGEESRGDGSSGSFLAAAAESLFEELLRGTGESEVPSCGRASEDAGAGDITEEEVRVWASDADRAARLACLHAVSLGVSEAPGFSSVPSWARSLASSSSRVYRRAYGARGHAERTLCALSALFRVLSQQLWALSWKERTGGGAQHVSMREALPVAHLCAACLWILLRAAPEASAFARAHIGELMDGGRGNEKEDDTGGVGSEGGGAGMTCRLAAEALGGGISACISILRSGASWTSVVGCLMEEMEKGPRGHAGGAVGSPERPSTETAERISREVAAVLGTLVPVAEWTLSRVSATGKGEGQIAPHALDALCLVVEQLCDPTFGRTPAIHVVADGEVPGTPVGPSRGDDPSGGRTGDHPALRTIAREMGREMVARAAAEIPGCPEAILAACGYVVGSGQSPHAPAELRGYSPRAMVTSPAWGALAAMSGGGALSGVIPVGWAPVVLALAITHAPSMSGTDLSLVLDVAADVVGPVLSDPAMVRACVRTLRLLSDPPGETTARDQAWEAASEAEESEEAAGRVLWALARTANGILIDTAQRSTAVVISALRASLSPALFSPPLLRHHLEGGPFPWLIDRAISVALRSPRVARLLSAHLTAVFAARPVSALPHFGRLRSLLLLRSDLPDGFGATDAATFPPPRGGAVSQGAAVAAGEGGAVCGEPFGINEWVEAGNTLLWSGTEHAPRAAVLALLERWCQMAVSGGEAVGCGDAVKTPAPRGEGAEAALAARLFLGMLLEDSLSDAMLADSRCVKVGVPRDAAGSPPFDLRICATHSVSVINSCVPFAGAMEMADGTLRVDLHASGPARTDCPRARSCRQHSISHRLQVRLFQGVGVLSNVVAEPAAVAASASPADFDMKVATDALRAVARDATAQISESLGQKGKLTRLKAKSSASKRPPAQGYDSLALLRGTQPSSSLVTLDACLRRQQIPGVRRLMEIALARIACSLPGAEARAFLRDRLLDLSSASETAVSYVALAGHLILRGREGDTAAHVRKLVPVMLPWAMVHQQGLRTMTLSTIREIFLSLPPAGPSSVLHASLPPTPPPAPNDSPTQISRDGGRDRGASARQMSSRSEGSGEDGPGTPGAGRGWAETWGEGAFLEAIQEHVLNHPDMKKLVLSCQPNVARHDPKEWVAVRTVMLATSSAPGHRALSPDGSPFEACPESVFEEINVYLNEARRDAKKAPGAGQHSRAQAAQGGAQPSTREGNVAGNTVADASGGTYQRKITPAGYQSEIYGASKPAAASQRSAQALRMLDVRAAKDGPILMEEVIGPTARRLAVDMAEFWDVSAGAGSRDRVANARSKAPGPVLVASLVDKVPNLAGLARTCEIFGAEQLVLPNMTCLKDPAFSEISVTAEKWLPMSAVAPGDLVSWLEQMRLRGYTLVGVEQTATSKSLAGFSFPEKCVLVLGREREGIDPPVLDVLDSCVEIPQLGLLRSLNVHVSGAITLYESIRGRFV